jgi:hypothetical protein
MDSVTVGRTVHYRMTPSDCEHIGPPANAEHNPGQLVPAIVVRVWEHEPDMCNLRVLFDGHEVAWKTSIRRGDEPGQWAWPERAPEVGTDTTGGLLPGQIG